MTLIAIDERHFWNRALKAWPDSALSGYGLEADDHEYLTKVGLPSGLSVGHLEIASPYESVANFICVARDGPVPLCIHPNAVLRVVAIEDSSVSRPVNSGVRGFGAFVVLYATYQRRVRGLSDDSAQTLIAQIEGRLRIDDPPALSDPEFYWPIILEQMRDGNL